MIPKPNTTSRLHQVFARGFSAMDLAESLVSFDAEADCKRILSVMEERDFDLVGVRRDGVVAGYLERDAPGSGSGSCGDHMIAFDAVNDLVPDTANLVEVVESLAKNSRCFVTFLDQVGGIITLSDLEKPPMRMFLFGIITLGEMLMTNIIRHQYPEDAWHSLIPPQRLARAQELQEERGRRGQDVELLDCLQYGDKGRILIQDEEFRETMQLKSRSEAKKAVHEMQSLRNNLAHTQEIIPTGWHRIVLACSRFEKNLNLLSERFEEFAGTDK